MRPYSGKILINETPKIFNYSLSRGQWIIKNTFHIIVAHWRIFQRPIEAEQEKTEKITLAAVKLHTYLRQTENTCYTLLGFIDSESSSWEFIPWQWTTLLDGNNLENVKPTQNLKYTNTALAKRQALANHLATVRSAPYQLDKLDLHKLIDRIIWKRTWKYIFCILCIYCKKRNCE